MDREAWQATVHGVAESDTTERLSMHAHILPQTHLPSRLPQNTEPSSLCATVSPCWWSTLNIAVQPSSYHTGFQGLSIPKPGCSKARAWVQIPPAKPGSFHPTTQPSTHFPPGAVKDRWAWLAGRAAIPNPLPPPRTPRDPMRSGWVCIPKLPLLIASCPSLFCFPPLPTGSSWELSLSKSLSLGSLRHCHILHYWQSNTGD